MKNTMILMLSALFCAGLARAAERNADLEAKANAAIEKGVRWLLAKQQEDGHWSNPDFPALTGLPLWVLAQQQDADSAAMDKAIRYILDSVHENGAIWREPGVKQKGGGLANYNTAICMTALHATGRPDTVPVVLKARQYLAGQQHLGGDIYHGGMGYDADTGRPYADLSNSALAYEAMRLTENLEDLRKQGDPKADLDWEAATEFIERVQNRRASNDQPWADDDPENTGGFAYKPDGSQAGSYTNEAGEIRFRSYGSMTYAGLLSFIYAQVDRNDPRVASAYDWAVRHWTLDENPGMGGQGLYYFYNVLAKALKVWNRDVLTLPDGTTVSWRDALIEKLLSLQKEDPETEGGFWVNTEGRWWESDPVLVTSYSLLALQAAVK